MTAGDGHEALASRAELIPAAITLDVMMPDMDGWTVLAAIKGDPELADIPVVLVTIVDEKNAAMRWAPPTTWSSRSIAGGSWTYCAHLRCTMGRRYCWSRTTMSRGRHPADALAQDGWKVAEAGERPR